MPNACYFMKFFEHNQCSLCSFVVSSFLFFLILISFHRISLPFYSSHRFPRPFFHFEIILICLVVHNKIAKLVHRPTNCTLYEYAWYQQILIPFLFFLLFSVFSSLIVDSVWLSAQRSASNDSTVHWCSALDLRLFFFSLP